MSEFKEKDLDFVVKHYKEGKLDTGKAIADFYARHPEAAPAPEKRAGWFYWAASAAAVIVVGIFFFFRLSNSEVVLVAQGDSECFLLPDSTSVTLARGASLTYHPRRFSRGDREVTLEGKGFFDVTGMGGAPFEVRTGNSYVKVLGTRFQVEVLPVAKVFVYQGKVLFSKSEKLEGVILTAGEGAILPKGGLKPNVMKGGTNEVAWLRGTFIFDNTPLKEALLEIGRYYGVSFGATDMSKRLTGEFSTEDLDLIITLIESALDVKIVKM